MVELDLRLSGECEWSEERLGLLESAAQGVIPENKWLRPVLFSGGGLPQKFLPALRILCAKGEMELAAAVNDAIENGLDEGKRIDGGKKGGGKTNLIGIKLIGHQGTLFSRQIARPRIVLAGQSLKGGRYGLRYRSWTKHWRICRLRF